MKAKDINIVNGVNYTGKHDVDSSTLEEFEDKQDENENMKIYTHDPVAKSVIDISTPLLTGYVNNNITTINKNYFLDKGITRNAMHELMKALYGYRNIYLYNSYRGHYKKEFEDHYSDQNSKMNIIPYICSAVDTELPQKHLNNALLKFLYARLFDVYNAIYENYTIENPIKTKIINDKDFKQCVEKYTIYKLPKNVQTMFNQITKYYNEALQHLTLNETTGYYEYVDKNIHIPIVCKHVIMSLQGVNTFDIAVECYKNGVCKYCGSNIVNSLDIDTFTLPSVAMSLILKAAECFRTSASNDTLIFTISDFIVTRIQYNKISVYDTNKCVIFTCIYLLKLFKSIDNKLKIFKSQKDVVIKKISQHLASSGVNQKMVEEMLNNDNMFGNIETLINALKSIEDNYNIKIVNFNNPESILFNSKNDRKVTNNLQKLYTTDREKILSLHIALFRLRNSLFNDNNLYYESSGNVECNIESSNKKIITYGLKFFSSCYSYYCPVNYSHEYVNNVCKHCGLQQDGKNIDDVYNKYFQNIINTSSSQPNSITDNIINDYNGIEKTYTTTEKDIIASINKLQTNDVNNTLSKWLNKYYNNTISETIMKNMKIKNIPFIKNISSIINISSETIIKEYENNDWFQLMLSAYAIKNVKEYENAIINYINMYFSPTFNPSLLITTSNDE